MSPERTSERLPAAAFRSGGRLPGRASPLAPTFWLAAIATLSIGPGCGDSEVQCETIIEARPYDPTARCLGELEQLVCSDQLPVATLEGGYMCVERDGDAYVGPETLRIDPTLEECDAETARAALDAPLCAVPDS